MAPACFGSVCRGRGNGAFRKKGARTAGHARSPFLGGSYGVASRGDLRFGDDPIRSWRTATLDANPYPKPRSRPARGRGGRKEWFFLQNVVYRDRALGYLIDHDKREVQVHEESSLRSLMQIRGWMDVLTLRFDPTIVPTLRDTGERRQTGSATFKHYVANAPGRSGVVEVWWSEGLLLPLSLTARASGVEVTSVVKGLTWSADAKLLAEPSVRFPSYKTLDPADARDHH